MKYTKILSIGGSIVFGILLLIFLDNRFGIISGRAWGGKVPLIEYVPVVVNPKKEIQLGEEVTLRKSEIAVIKNPAIEFKIKKFDYNPCPKDAMCFWGDHDVSYELTIDGKVYEGSFFQMPDEIPYAMTLKETDSKTYVTFTITEKNSNEQTEENEQESNIFSLSAIEVGDSVGSMIVTSIEPYNKKYRQGVPPTPLSDTNAAIAFKGDVELTGTYYYTTNGIPSDEYCFSGLDEVSLTRLPQLDTDQRSVWFCFTNEDKAQELLGKNRGTVTITVNAYEIQSFPSEVWNTATLVSVENVVVEEEAYTNSELGFSFVIPEGYTYKDLGKEPLYLGQLAEIRIGSPEQINAFVIDQTSTELWISVWDRVQDYELRTATKDGEECSSPFSQVGTVTIAGETVAKCYAKDNDPVEQYNARYHYPLKADDGHVYLFVVDSLPDGNKTDLDRNDTKMQTILNSFFFL